MAEVLPIETPGLGDRSYLVHDGSAALVIDPQRDTDRITALAGAHGVRITHIAETHIHNDYLTGGPALAAATGAAYLVNAADPVAFDRAPVADGDHVEVGDTLRVRVLATPGHTFTHLSYVLESGGRVAGVFTGGSLLYGATGRPDLLGPAHTGTLARAQYTSAHRLAAELPAPPRSSRRTGSAASARPGRPAACPRRSAPSGWPTRCWPWTSARTWPACSPAWTPGPPTTRTWARPTWPGRPARTCRRHARPARTRCGAAWTQASG